MRITRHFIDVGTGASRRRVHYRRCGQGPALLMVHQSPRSSAEYADLMRRWGRDFTCIAPDSPGFGQSDAFADPDATIADFADGLVDLLDALGIDRVPAYGFHSGGIILVTALRRHPDRFSALAIGGYAIWTEAERRLFSESYLPPFRPDPYGSHLVWLWNRILEQSWFFPWFDTRPARRLPVAHADPARVDAVVREMLDAGDAYRTGYGAVLRASRDIPGPDEPTAPVLIAAYDGDPLQEHIDRLGALPAQWSARKVASPTELEEASIAFLRDYCVAVPELVEAQDEGFVAVDVPGFAGLIHWRGRLGGALTIHAAGRSAELLPGDTGLAIDVPGHGLSDDWDGAAPTDPAAWQAVFAAAGAALEAGEIGYEPAPDGETELLFPDLTPDRFGAYLTKAWSIVRAAHFFAPWYCADASHGVDFSVEDIAPERLAREHRALLQARSARAWHAASRAIAAARGETVGQAAAAL